MIPKHATYPPRPCSVWKNKYRNGIALVFRLEIFGVSNARLSAAGKAESTAGFARDVLPALGDGRIVPLIDRVYPFAELQAAKDCMESSAMVGKIVIRNS